ncbi:MAG: hypothetical protein ACRCX2_20260 [Paraclostridium sp.]
MESLITKLKETRGRGAIETSIARKKYVDGVLENLRIFSKFINTNPEIEAKFNSMLRVVDREMETCDKIYYKYLSYFKKELMIIINEKKGECV